MAQGSRPERVGEEIRHELATLLSQITFPTQATK